MVITIIVILLMLIAGIVSYRQYKYGNRDQALTWAFIVAYWVVLTVKNFIDLLGQF